MHLQKEDSKALYLLQLNSNFSCQILCLWLFGFYSSRHLAQPMWSPEKTADFGQMETQPKPTVLPAHTPGL